MIAECFLDSNIILYAYMDDDRSKKERAQEILALTDCCISSQVVGEVCCNLIKKAGFSEAEVIEIIDEFYSLYQVIPIDHSIFHTASHLRSVHSFSYWDSFIVSAAIEAGVNTLYSEDMQHGLKVKGVTITNPFKEK